MKIISGTYKGRRLLSLKSKIRPTSEKVREALFDILGDVSGLTLMDLYAGCGAVGFEAISRGADRVTFVEKKGRICRYIRSNILELGMDVNTVKILCMDALHAVKLLNEQNSRFNLIFADPPYLSGECGRLIDNLMNIMELVESGYFILQAHKRENLKDVNWEDVRNYGETGLYFLRND
ncbi:16S rRNA (guanine(966)-N(2))-methyltransferase RsmD [bacterium]|nr:16S rRNA (guanine(966)-N(2))-methyltransferase RsmD [bacterium]